MVRIILRRGRDTGPWGKKGRAKNMAKTTPNEFFRQVRAEMQKVTWPSRKETTTSAIAVFTMVFLASAFLFIADQLMASLVHWLLGLGL